MVLLQVNTTNPKKYNIMPNIGDMKPRSSCDIKGLSLFNFFFKCCKSSTPKMIYSILST
jgi:hypothetical protein